MTPWVKMAFGAQLNLHICPKLKFNDAIFLHYRHMSRRGSSSKFFSRGIDSDTSSSSSSSSSSSEDELDMMNDSTHFATLNSLCGELELLLKVTPIINVRWPLVKKGIEDVQKTANLASANGALEKPLIDRLANVFILLEDVLQASKAFSGAAGSAGVASKQASLLQSRLQILKPSVISSSLLASIRSASASTSGAAIDDKNMDEQSDEMEDDDSSRCSSSSSSSEDEQAHSYFSARGTASAADKWKKKEFVRSTAETQSASSTIKKQPQRAQQIPKHGDASEELLLQIETEHYRTSFEAMTPNEGLKRYEQIMTTRGRRSADRAAQIKELESISAIIGLSAIDRIQIKLTLVSFYFERPTSLSAAAWINMLVNVLSELVNLGLQSDISPSSTAELKDLSFAPSSSSLLDSLLASVQRLDDEYNNLLLASPIPNASGSPTMMMATTDSSGHSFEYVELLRLERPVYLLIAKMQFLCANFCKKEESTEIKEAIHDLTLRRLSHIYLKSVRGIKKMDTLEHSDIVMDMVPESVAYKLLEFSGMPTTGISLSVSEMVPIPAPLRMAAFLLLSQEGVSETRRARALLYLISWIAGNSFPISVPSPFLLGKGLLIGSSLSESIMWADLHIQVLYNRALALLGLAAFKEGRLKASMMLLGELLASGRCRELIGQAQGGSSSLPDDPTTAGFRATTVMPWHTWISIESFEMIYLLSSVLVEIPQAILRGCVGGNQQSSSFPKPLRRLLAERTMAIQDGPDPGPGASSRDLIAGIARFILAGDWKHANGLLVHLRLPVTSAGILSHIKRASFISLFGKNSSSWTSLDVSAFAEFFEMSLEEVLSLIKGWISESTSNAPSSTIGLPYLDTAKKWIYAHEQFTITDKTAESSEMDKFALWTSGLQLTSAISVLSDKLSALSEEHEKMFHKRNSITTNGGSSISIQKYPLPMKSKSAF